MQKINPKRKFWLVTGDIINFYTNIDINLLINKFSYHIDNIIKVTDLQLPINYSNNPDNIKNNLINILKLILPGKS